ALSREPLVAGLAADTKPRAQAAHVGTWNRCQSHKLLTQRHGRSFLPRHGWALLGGPMIPSAAVTHVSERVLPMSPGPNTSSVGPRGTGGPTGVCRSARGTSSRSLFP